MENLLAEVERDGGCDNGKCAINVRVLNIYI